jgi:ribosomal protein L39E
MKKQNVIDSKRIGIWIRVLTEDQVRGESPEHHERRARLYAEAKGWNVVESTCATTTTRAYYQT